MFFLVTKNNSLEMDTRQTENQKDFIQPNFVNLTRNALPLELPEVKIILLPWTQRTKRMCRIWNANNMKRYITYICLDHFGRNEKMCIHSDYSQSCPVTSGQEIGLWALRQTSKCARIAVQFVTRPLFVLHHRFQSGPRNNRVIEFACKSL